MVSKFLDVPGLEVLQPAVLQPPRINTYSPQVERYRQSVWDNMPTELQKRPDAARLLDKYLYVMQGESGGNPVANHDGGAGYGLMADRVTRTPVGTGAEQQIKNGWKLVQNNPDKWTDWGEGALYQGKPFGVLGATPYGSGIKPPSVGDAGVGTTTVPGYNTLQGRGQGKSLSDYLNQGQAFDQARQQDPLAAPDSGFSLEPTQPVDIYSPGQVGAEGLPPTSSPASPLEPSTPPPVSPATPKEFSDTQTIGEQILAQQGFDQQPLPPSRINDAGGVAGQYGPLSPREESQLGGERMLAQQQFDQLQPPAVQAGREDLQAPPGSLRAQAIGQPALGPAFVDTPRISPAESILRPLEPARRVAGAVLDQPALDALPGGAALNYGLNRAGVDTPSLGEFAQSDVPVLAPVSRFLSPYLGDLAGKAAESIPGSQLATWTANHTGLPGPKQIGNFLGENLLPQTVLDVGLNVATAGGGAEALTGLPIDELLRAGGRAARAELERRALAGIPEARRALEASAVHFSNRGPIPVIRGAAETSDEALANDAKRALRDAGVNPHDQLVGVSPNGTRMDIPPSLMGHIDVLSGEVRMGNDAGTPISALDRIERPDGTIVWQKRSMPAPGQGGLFGGAVDESGQLAPMEGVDPQRPFPVNSDPARGETARQGQAFPDENTADQMNLLQEGAQTPPAEETVGQAIERLRRLAATPAGTDADRVELSSYVRWQNEHGYLRGGGDVAANRAAVESTPLSQVKAEIAGSDMGQRTPAPDPSWERSRSQGDNAARYFSEQPQTPPPGYVRLQQAGKEGVYQGYAYIRPGDITQLYPDQAGSDLVHIHFKRKGPQQEGGAFGVTRESAEAAGLKVPDEVPEWVQDSRVGFQQFMDEHNARMGAQGKAEPPETVREHLNRLEEATRGQKAYDHPGGSPEMNELLRARKWLREIGHADLDPAARALIDDLPASQIGERLDLPKAAPPKSSAEAERQAFEAAHGAPPIEMPPKTPSAPKPLPDRGGMPQEEIQAPHSDLTYNVEENQMRDVTPGKSYKEATVQGYVDNWDLSKFVAPLAAPEPGQPGKYRIFSGHHRTEAWSRVYGDTAEMPLHVVQADLNNPDQLAAMKRLAITENYTTAPSNFREQVRAVQGLGNKSQADIASDLGMTATKVEQLQDVNRLGSQAVDRVTTDGSLQPYAAAAGRGMRVHGVSVEDANGLFNRIANGTKASRPTPAVFAETLDKFGSLLREAEARAAQGAGMFGDDTGQFAGMRGGLLQMMDDYARQQDALNKEIRALQRAKSGADKLAAEAKTPAERDLAQQRASELQALGQAKIDRLQAELKFNEENLNRASRGEPPLTPPGEPPPPPPGEPPPPSGRIPTPAGADPPVDVLNQTIELGAAVAPETRVANHEDLAQRVAQADSMRMDLMRNGVAPEIAMEQSRSMLRGQMQQAEFEPPPELSGHLPELHARIAASEASYFTKNAAHTALDLLAQGIFPMAKSVGNLNHGLRALGEVFGPRTLTALEDLGEVLRLEKSTLDKLLREPIKFPGVKGDLTPEAIGELLAKQISADKEVSERVAGRIVDGGQLKITKGPDGEPVITRELGHPQGLQGEISDFLDDIPDKEWDDFVEGMGPPRGLSGPKTTFPPDAPRVANDMFEPRAEGPRLPLESGPVGSADRPLAGGTARGVGAGRPRGLAASAGAAA